MMKDVEHGTWQNQSATFRVVLRARIQPAFLLMYLTLPKFFLPKSNVQYKMFLQFFILSVGHRTQLILVNLLVFHF